MSTLSFLNLVEGDTFSHGRIIPRDAPDSRNSNRTWIIAASVAIALTVAACAVLLAMSLSKRRLRKQSLEEARLRDPCLGEKEFSKKGRTRKDTLDYDAESQRDAIIRKSLASRSGRSASESSHFATSVMSMEERPDSRSTQEYRHEEVVVKRSLSLLRSGSGLDEKSREAGVSARSKPSLPDLPARTYSRSSSPALVVQNPPERPELPPSLEQHPLFRNGAGGLGLEFEHR